MCAKSLIVILSYLIVGGFGYLRGRWRAWLAFCEGAAGGAG